MKVLLKASILVLLFSTFSIAQDDPMPVLRSSWERATQRAQKPVLAPQGPAKPIIAENKYFQRKAREQRTDNPMDPYEASIEGRSAAMDRAVQESRAPQPDDVSGYHYVAEIRNDTGKTVDVVFWEYRFTEIARPTNVVRRQFLCGTKLKNGEKRELSAFSLLGPSDVIDAESLAQKTGKLFEESVIINRIEFSDGAIIQRHGWKLQDVKAGVERATSTPWGREICRGI